MQVSEKLLKKCKPAKGHVLVLKSIAANMKAYGGFQWPESGIVSAPDWKETEECGNGLHGWKWGAGDASLRCDDDDAKWMVLSVNENQIVDLGRKMKFPSCEVLYCGDREAAVRIVQYYAPHGTPVIFGTATAGYRGTATAGDGGTATAGHGGTATAGDYGTATAGHGGTATAGDEGTATAGNRGTATAGNRGTATAGYRGTATAGDYGTATAGDYGTATAGYRGTATAGDGGTATAGDYGTATAGDEGTIIIQWWDKSNEKMRKKIAIVDGVTILPNVKYRLNATSEFERVGE